MPLLLIPLIIQILPALHCHRVQGYTLMTTFYIKVDGFISKLSAASSSIRTLSPSPIIDWNVFVWATQK
jgi:hypothetical protein